MIMDISTLVSNCLNDTNSIKINDKFEFLEIFENMENDELISKEDEIVDIENMLLVIMDKILENVDNQIHTSDNITTKYVSEDMKEKLNLQSSIDKDTLISNIIEKINLDNQYKVDLDELLNKVEVKEKIERIISDIEKIELTSETPETQLNFSINKPIKLTTENLFYKSMSTSDENNQEISILNNIVTQYNKNYTPLKQVEPIVIREQFVNQDIVKTINYLKNNDMQELKVNLSPKDLGNMTIKLIKNETDTKLLITLSKDDVFDLVNKNIKDIQNHLSTLDIKIKEISIEVRTENQNSFSDGLNQDLDRNNSNHQNQRNFNGNRNESIVENQDDIKIESDEINLFA